VRKPESVRPGPRVPAALSQAAPRDEPAGAVAGGGEAAV